MTDNVERRKDDTMLREMVVGSEKKVSRLISTVIGLVVTILLGLFAYFQSFGNLEGRVTNNEDNILKLFNVTENLVEIQNKHQQEYYQNTIEVRVRMERIQSDIANISSGTDKMSAQLGESLKNQNQIIPTVKQAQEFMTDHDRKYGEKHK